MSTDPLADDVRATKDKSAMGNLTERPGYNKCGTARGWPLTTGEREVLAVLDTRAGTQVRDIARKVPLWSSNRRINSGLLAYTLKTLEAFGYVKKLDDLKPIAWVAVQEPVAEALGQIPKE